jgi:molybdenum cofactor biosynthesis enzyme MoaA
MNELDISIISPYTGKESLPDISYADLMYKHFCVEPIINQNILRYSFDNDKGYRFYTKPCLCFLDDKNFEIHTDDFDELFDSEKIKSFKSNVIKEDYSNCSKCSKYQNYKQGSDSAFYNWKSFIEEYGLYGKRYYYNKDKIEDYPLYSINLNVSEVCNLKCKPCRKDFIIKEPDLTPEDYEKIIKKIKSVKRLKIGCDGETFFSKIYMKILSEDLTKDSELENVEIFTNGTCMTEKRLKEIHPNNWNIIKEVRISIDAATKETYKLVRANNDNQWENLLKNIKYLKENYNVKMASCFTISKYNYKDTMDFIDFAENLGFEEVVFAFAKPRLKDNDRECVITNETYKKDIIEKINEIVFYKSRKINVVMT